MLISFWNVWIMVIALPALVMSNKVVLDGICRFNYKALKCNILLGDKGDLGSCYKFLTLVSHCIHLTELISLSAF